LSGEAYAIICAFLWALSSTIVKSQTHKVPVVLLNALRTVPATLIYWGFLLVTGRIGEPFALPLRFWAFLAGSTLIGLAIGDLLYFQSMKYIGLGRALPLSNVYPFFTMLWALALLDEEIGLEVVGGAALIVSGAYLLAFPRGARGLNQGGEGRDLDLEGVAMALGAAVCWGASTVLLRLGLENVPVVVANVIRLSLLAVILFGIAARQRQLAQIPTLLRRENLRTLGIILLAGILGMTLGTLTFLAAVQRAGAARTSILTAAMPLFGVPFSLTLGERLTARTALGTVLTIGGVWLTIWQ
jgi:drug/metabolite transporter (DMT)-like permease